MHSKAKRIVAAGMALVALLALPTSTLASSTAQGKGLTRIAPIQGVVTALSSSTLAVQTKTGNTSVALGSSTHVMRLSILSLSDLAPNMHVHLGLNKASNTVNSVQVLANVQKSRAPRSGNASKAKSAGTVVKHTFKHSKTAAGSHNLVDGQVNAVTNHSLTIIGRNSQSATYTFAANVSVTEVVPGHLTDLALGQTVQIRQEIRKGATVSSVLILKG